MEYTNKLKVVILTGNKVRHKYFVNVMKEKFDVIGSIFEPHYDYFNLQREESALVRKHFKNLDKYEKTYLDSDLDYSDLNHTEIKAKHINKAENISWVKSLNPDYNGEVDLAIRISDNDSSSDKVIFKLVIHPRNDPPTVELLGDTDLFMNNENYPNDINIKVKTRDVEESNETITLKDFDVVG